MSFRNSATPGAVAASALKLKPQPRVAPTPLSVFADICLQTFF
ncbi:hypothetical protein [Aureliella helgolandensis]|nr:hypothetical protein [Aureliella helgolandensis]